MEQIVVKTEVQSNGEILLYYVDENGENQEGVLTTIDNIDNSMVQLEGSSYILGDYGIMENDPSVPDQVEEDYNTWSDEEVKRLLVFYNDNKASFTSGTTQIRHLWVVACKTMLVGKNYQACQDKIAELREKYSEVRGYIKRGVYVKWPFLDLCHQAFHDDPELVEMLENKVKEEPKIVVEVPVEKSKESSNIVVLKHVNKKPEDAKVVRLLNLYLTYKASFQKEHYKRELWEHIARLMGETDSEHLQKRFLNFKKHYIILLTKKMEDASVPIDWPYMELFDKIFEDDADFQKKYCKRDITAPKVVPIPENEWTDPQKIVLVKYYFDCYHEFEDPTIPNQFLWTEVGRLVDKKPDTCKIRYELLRREHLERYMSGAYSLQGRQAISIIFDHIISRDVRRDLNKIWSEDTTYVWKDEEIDVLVQFIFDNLELFKDPVCYFVCWAAVARNLKRGVAKCKKQWEELIQVYRSLLEQKKENSALQIVWRYMELFDRIFDYGVDSHLMNGFQVQLQEFEKPSVKKVMIKDAITENDDNAKSDPDYKVNEPRTDPRSTKILEFYLKNKDKFQHAKNKHPIWEQLAKVIGMNSSQCAHRFRVLKQTYIEQVQKEMDKPRQPITWPYFALCKKVFGFRNIKNKIKQGLMDNTPDEWSEDDIKRLIDYFSSNFHVINNNTADDIDVWTPLSNDIDRSVVQCKDKFVELRKCYRKLKTMKRRNPDVKISWNYFSMFENIYAENEETPMEVETVGEQMEMQVEDTELGDDDYQCIIVLQEGEEIPTDLGNAQIIIQKRTDSTPEPTHSLPDALDPVPPVKWTTRSKKRLLILYINYIRSNRGTEIDPKPMWNHIAGKLPKSPCECRKMLNKLKVSYKSANEDIKKTSPLTILLEKVMKLKPKFVKKDQSKRSKLYTDVEMSSDKVDKALRYYLEHIDDFVNPKFKKKYLWSQLAEHISEPVSKAYNKVNYLKQEFNIETEEIGGEKTEFSYLLKEIIAKELAVKMLLDVNPNPDFPDQETSWGDEETEQLLLWYLSNLEKFKNPKFNKSYLWMEASSILNKSPLVCSKKMTEVRTQYRDMVKNNDESLPSWRFFELCQKIYGTGKKSAAENP